MADSKISVESSKNAVSAKRRPVLPEGDLSRYSFFPITYTTFYDFYKKHLSIHWVKEEINFANDRDCWNRLRTDKDVNLLMEKLNIELKAFDQDAARIEKIKKDLAAAIKESKIRRMVKGIICFFSPSDGIVIQNLSENLIDEFSHIKEAKAFYAIQMASETVHNETYGTLINIFLQDDNEKKEAFDSLRTYDSIGYIAEWMFQKMSKKIPRIERVVGFVCVEVVLFMGAFMMIYYVMRNNILEGLTKSNEWIARDETLHGKFGIELYNILTGPTCKDEDREERLPFSKVAEIITSAVDIAKQFIQDILGVQTDGESDPTKEGFPDMTVEDLYQYVYATANYVSTSMGYKEIYKNVKPVEWMLAIGLNSKTNFFESKVSEYTKADNDDYTFKMDESF